MDGKWTIYHDLNAKLPHFTIDKDEATLVSHIYMSMVIYNELKDLEALFYHRMMIQWFNINTKHTKNLVKMDLSDEQRTEITWLRRKESKLQFILETLL
jgi:hypothetical protein